MHTHTLNSTWWKAKSMLRLYALNSSNHINSEDLNIQFNESGISLRYKMHVSFLDYSDHYIVDLERVIDLLMCSFNMNIIHSPHKYLDNYIDSIDDPDDGVEECEGEYFNVPALRKAFIPRVCIDPKLEAELKSSMIHIDSIYQCLTPYIDQFKNYNEWFHMINEDHTKTLETASIKLYEMDAKFTLNDMKINDTYISLNDQMLSTRIFVKASTPYKNSIMISMQLFYMYLSEKERGYFISDIKKLSNKKLRYVWEKLSNRFYENMMPLEFAYHSYIEHDDMYSNLSWITYNKKNAFNMYSAIGNTIPNHIEDYPFEIFLNNIPSLSTYPQTPFNWILTQVGVGIEGIGFNDCINAIVPINSSDSIRHHTERLLKYIQCPEKAFELYVCYVELMGGNEDGIDVYEEFMDFIDECTGKGLSNYLNLAVKHGYYTPDDNESIETSRFKCDVGKIHQIIRQFIKFIDDGRELYETYPDELVFDDISIKLVPVEGTLLKQIKSSIYNHNEERKITTEQKLRLLCGGELMEHVVEIPEALLQYHMKFKKSLVFAGKELGHCIGSKTESKNLFFRNGSVCAEVSYNDDRFTVSTCLDAKNQNTENAEAFRRLIEGVIDGLVPVKRTKVD